MDERRGENVKNLPFIGFLFFDSAAGFESRPLQPFTKPAGSQADLTLVH